MNTKPRSGQLLALVLRAKDEVYRQQKETYARFVDLHERLGRLVALDLEDPAKAKAEVLALCDLEYDLTGDCVATGDIAELIDPDGEFFMKQRGGPSYVLDDSGDEFSLEAIPNITAEQRVHLRVLEIGDCYRFESEAGERSVTRVS